MGDKIVMNQKQNIELIKKIFKQRFSDAGDKIRFIKIHGSQYQEAGLPDLMILISTLPNGPLTAWTKRIQLRFWFEIKRNWKDEPTPLQKHNIQNLFQFGFHTGYIAGDEIKLSWHSKEIKLKSYLKDIIK